MHLDGGAQAEPGGSVCGRLVTHEHSTTSGLATPLKNRCGYGEQCTQALDFLDASGDGIVPAQRAAQFRQEGMGGGIPSVGIAVPPADAATMRGRLRIHGPTRP